MDFQFYRLFSHEDLALLESLRHHASSKITIENDTSFLYHEKFLIRKKAVHEEKAKAILRTAKMYPELMALLTEEATIDTIDTHDQAILDMLETTAEQHGLREVPEKHHIKIHFSGIDFVLEGPILTAKQFAHKTLGLSRLRSDVRAVLLEAVNAA